MIGDQGMVKRDARTSPSSRYFLWYPSIAAQQANSPLGAQTRKSAFRTSHLRHVAERGPSCCAPNGHFSLFFRDRIRTLLALVPRSGAAWNYATCRDRPIQDYRQHCAADVDHYVAQRGRPRWNERLMKFIGCGISRTEQ